LRSKDDTDICRGDNLPVVIEAVDSEDAINAAMEKIDLMISDGLITLEKVDVIRYAPKKK